MINKCLNIISVELLFFFDLFPISFESLGNQPSKFVALWFSIWTNRTTLLPSSQLFMTKVVFYANRAHAYMEDPPLKLEEKIGQLLEFCLKLLKI